MTFETMLFCFALSDFLVLAVCVIVILENPPKL